MLRLLRILLSQIAVYLGTDRSRNRRSSDIRSTYDMTSLLIRRTYSNGPEVPRTATAAATNRKLERSVTFVRSGLPPPITAASLPVWETLDEGPVFELGPEDPEGEAREYIIPPSEYHLPISTEETIGLVEEFAEEEHLPEDMTEEERRAIETFDVRAFH